MTVPGETAPMPAPDRRGRRAPWRQLARGLADLLLPRACAVCQSLLPSAGSALVCGACWARCHDFPAPVCRRCGHPRQALPGGALTERAHAERAHTERAHTERAPSDAAPAGSAGAGEDDGFARCRWCPRLPPTVRAVRSVARVDVGTASAIVHALKYDGWTGVADEMGRRMARVAWPADVVAERAALVPVPLAPTRERERGFNQSALLAEAVGRQWGLPVWSDVLVRGRVTASQTRLTPSERTANVSGAFGTDPGVTARVRGTHLVLVDDVITTAATLNAAASALIDRGARLVSYLTFGRAPDAGDRPSHVSDPDCTP
jgi:ComF family protein